MKKFAGILAFVVSAASLSTFAVGAGITGYEPDENKGKDADDGLSSSFSCKIGQGGIVFRVEQLVLVRLAREGSLPAGSKPNKNEAGEEVATLRYQDNPEAFRGTVYAVPLGKNWPGKGPNIDSLNLSGSLGSAQTGKNEVAIPMEIKNNAQWQPFNLVFEGNFGRAWLGVEGNGYQARNRNNAPLLLVGSRCQQPDPESLRAMASAP